MAGRTDDELEDAVPEALVLRGGDLVGPSRLKNLRKCVEAYGVYGICATAGVAADPQALALSGARFGNENMMIATAREVEEAGLRVIREPDHDWPDALIVFPSAPSDDDWQRLREVMNSRPAESNPRYRGKK